MGDEPRRRDARSVDVEFVSVGEGNGQGLVAGRHHVAATTSPPVDEPAPDADDESADSEKQAAGTEGDIERHDFIPR